MKYEFKPFSYASYLNNLSEGWKATYRVAEEYPNGTPRDVEIVDLGEIAVPHSRIVSIDLREGGTVRHHDIQGRFDLKGVPSCLDLILYRDATPKPREIRGVAYISEFGEVVTVSPDYIDGEAKNCTAVRCTITLHEPS